MILQYPYELKITLTKLELILCQITEGNCYDTVKLHSSLSYIKYLLSAYQYANAKTKKSIEQSLELEVDLLRDLEKRSPTYFVSGETIHGLTFTHEIYADSKTDVVNKINALYQVKSINDLYFVGLIEPSKRLNPIT